MDAILSTLGLNLPAFLWHLFNFLVLLVLLRLVLYKPVVRILDERARRVSESLQHAEAVRRQSEQAEADRQALLQETRREAEQIRMRADEQAKRILAESDQRAQASADRIMAQAQAGIEASRVQMESALRAQVADLIVSAVDRVTRQAIDAQGQKALIQQFLSTETDGRGGPPAVGV